ncbi:MAG: hypothetical protein CMH57_13085 [Myxococcales bacterium]|nr:hypothetical protein [Myxococcales bacterium]
MIAATSLLLFFADTALTHGPAPSPLRVFGVTDGGEPDIVTTSMGLTWHDGGEGYTYGCPSQWGSSELTTPLVEVMDRDTLMVVGADALYTSTSRACPLAALNDPEAPAPSRVTDLHAVPGRIWGVANEISGDDLRNQTWAWSPTEGFQTAFWMDDRKLDSILDLGDTLLLAGARPEPVLITFPSDAALPVEESQRRVTPLSLPTAAPIERLSLRHVEEGEGGALRIWMVGTWASELHLVRSDDGGLTWTELGSAVAAIHGPVPLCGGALAVADGALLPDPEHAPSCSLEPLESRMFACLRESAGEVYFCELRQLKHVVQPQDPADGLTVETWYRLEQITGPDTSCAIGGESATQACEQDWLHEAAEAGLVTDFGESSGGDAGASDDAFGGEDVGGEDSGGGESGGCSLIAGRSGASGWFLITAMIALGRWRRAGR